MKMEGNRFVVDASVGIKLFIDEPGSDAAQALFGRLGNNPPVELFVPDLFFIECANILLKVTRRFGRPLEDGLADLQDLSRLMLKNFPTAGLIIESLQLANEKNLTAYDACYAALASKLEIPLITADATLARKIDWAVLLFDYNQSVP